jgi:hypothetical protein
MSGYTYEIWSPDRTDEPTQWGTFAADDLAYQGGDLAQAAAEIVNVLLIPPPWLPPLEGELRLWPAVTGTRIEGEPGHRANIAALRDA